MSRVLVTGASGFVGVPLLAKLSVRRGEVDATYLHAVPPETPGVRWHRLDLADSHAVDALLADISPDALVHAAWYVEHGRFWSAPENVLWVEHSLRLLRAFVRAGGRRVVMLGSCAEYDWSAAEQPFDETESSVGPSTLYGVAKDSLRRVAEAYAKQEGIGLAWARLFFMYGPREDPRRLVPSVIRALLRGESIATTSGEQVRDYMHIDDVAGALTALVDSPVVGPVDIASGRRTHVRDVVEEIAAQLDASGLLRLGDLPDRPGEPHALVGTGRRLHEEVGYRAQIELTDGIADVVRWWRGRS